MGPLRPVTVFLHLGTVVLLTQGAAFSWKRCPDKRQYFDETGGACKECRPCLKVKPTWDRVVIMDECEQKNPNATYTNDKTGEEFYHWCNTESAAYIKWLRSLETTTTAKSTMDAVHLKTTIGSTSVTEITQPTTSPQPQEYTKPIGSNVSLALGFGITAGLLFCFLLVIIAIWYRYRRGSPSLTSSSTNSTRASNSSVDEEKNLISSVVERADSILPAPTVHHERALGASGFHPIQISASPNPVVEGGPLLLNVDRPCLECMAIWEHEPSNIQYIDKVDIAIVSRYHEGRYNVVLCCSGKKHWSQYIDISIARVGENNLLIDVQSGIDRAVESSDDSSTLELAVRTESSIVPWMGATLGATVVQPSTDHDGSSQLVPSSQSDNTLMQNMMHVLIGIDTSPPTRQGPQPDGRCSLLIRDLLNNDIAMLQVAILFDPTHMIRWFAAAIGDMTPVEIDFVEYQRKGSGNTVRGVFKFIIDRKRGDLTAYDFLDFMWRKGWQCGQVITLLYHLHMDCPKCGDLYRRGGEKSDVANGTPPGLEYHRINEFNHCAQTLKSLAKEKEEFRQESKILFETELWRSIGSHLGGMTLDLLDYIELHNKGQINSSCYLTMLDRLVILYPYLKVGTLIQWLLDHNRKDAAELVLRFHMKTDCTFCRSYQCTNIVREDSAL